MLSLTKSDELSRVRRMLIVARLVLARRRLQQIQQQAQAPTPAPKPPARSE